MSGRAVRLKWSAEFLTSGLVGEAAKLSGARAEVTPNMKTQGETAIARVFDGDGTKRYEGEFASAQAARRAARIVLLHLQGETRAHRLFELIAMPPHVVTVGVGKDELILYVHHRRCLRDVKRRAPREFEGVPVRIKLTGKILPATD